MKITKLSSLVLSLLLISGTLLAQSNFEVKNFEMSIDGTSSLHDWTSQVTQVYAEGKLDLSNGTLGGINNLVVTVPVTSIESGKNVMDKKTYNALESDDHPTITYELTKVLSLENTNGSYKLKTEGTLTIAGTTKTVQMTVKGTTVENGVIRFEGSKSLKMTDFNVDPPTALLGTLKTGDEVTVNFALTLNANKG
jgi:polyisoprenoid-binding protein YceI